MRTAVATGDATPPTFGRPPRWRAVVGWHVPALDLSHGPVAADRARSLGDAWGAGLSVVGPTATARAVVRAPDVGTALATCDARMRAATQPLGLTGTALGGWTVHRRRWWGWEHAATGVAHPSFSTS